MPEGNALLRHDVLTDQESFAVMSENTGQGLRNGSATGHTVVNSGGTQIVPSEGHAGSTTVNAGGTQIISARQGDVEDKKKPEETPSQDPKDKKGDGSGDPDDKGGGGKGGRRKILPRVIFLVVLLVVAICAFIYWWSGRNDIGTDDAYTDGRAVSIAPRVSGRVVSLNVNDNQLLRKGQVIIQLDPRDYQAALDKATGTLLQYQGMLEEQQIDLAKARITFPANLLEAQGNLEQAQANLLNAQQTYRRQHKVSPAATTQEQVDQATAGVGGAEGQLKQAQGQLQVAQLTQQNIAQAQSRVTQLQGQVKTAQAQVDQAKLNLSYTTVTAPQDGWVTQRNVEVGYYLSAGQSIMDLVVPEVWVTANFKETQLTRMRPGQVVDIAVDAYPSLHLKGHVGSIQMGSGSRFSAFPAENATGNFVKIVQRVPVKIIIDSGLDPRMPLPLGLSVEPTVNITQTISNPSNGGVENEVPAQP
jgi:membrane fusion protein (multidrug efflux system)